MDDPQVPTKPLAQRCAPHGLSVAPDGLCIRCRRARDVTTTPDASTGAGSGRVAWLLAALGFAGAIAFALAARPHALPAADSPPTAATAPVRVEPTVAPAVPREPMPPGMDAPSVIAPMPEAALAPTAPSPQVEPEPDSIKEAEAYVAAARARREAEHRGQAAASVTVIMYSTSWCGYCRRARAWLDSRGIAYADHDIERESEARERMRAINPRGGVPTFEIDQQVLTGFSAGQLEQAIAMAAQRRAGR